MTGQIETVQGRFLINQNIGPSQRRYSNSKGNIESAEPGADGAEFAKRLDFLLIINKMGYFYDNISQNTL